MNPSAKSLILDLLSTLRRGSAMPVGALVEAGALFGISANNMRVSVTRLLAAGQIARDERGRYALGDTWRPIGQRVRSWRNLQGRTRKWNGSWVGVHVTSAARTEQRGRERALRLLGFGQLRPTLWVRPDNLTHTVAALRAELTSLGLPDGDLVFGLRELDPASEARARGLWDIDALRNTYRKLLVELDASAKRLGRLGGADAMVESFLLGGRAVRELVLDPLLPESIYPGKEREALVERLRRYDQLGRLAWARLLRRFDVPYLRSPLDRRMDSASAPRSLRLAV
jgi:phenylacetic acid degradation operon negative regulatory protein